MVKVILARHGETEWNRLRRFQGRSDPPLNELGKRQAECLADRLKAEDIRAVYASPLLRSLETAHAIARGHRLEVAVEPDLSELNLGDLEGTPIDDLRLSYDELLVLNGKGEELPKVPGGESLPELQERAWRAVQRLSGGHEGGAIVVVSHYFTILTIICAVLELPLSHVNRLRLTRGSISAFVAGPKMRLEQFNDACHLPAE
ncbi:MAG: histidine phosphatase family protein [Chloroflexota bacterium]